MKDRDIDHITRSLKAVLDRGHTLVPVPRDDLRALLRAIETYKAADYEALRGTVGERVNAKED